ncbi:MAG: TatD family hydrolase [Bacillota bacterium]
MLIDTHTHLNDEKFRADLPEVVDRAVQAGISAMIVVGYDLTSSRRAVEIAEKYDCCWAAAGVHPLEAERHHPFGREWDDLLRHKKTAAVGEIGLDYFYRQDTGEKQKALFREQMEQALRFGLPVIIHDRDAHRDVWDILSPYAGKVAGVMHCFSGSREMAEQYVKMGFRIGIDGPVTFKNARKLPDVLGKISLGSLLLETDCPYMAPHPYRGKRNEPSFLPLIAARAAAIKGISTEEMTAATTRNARELFHI